MIAQCVSTRRKPDANAFRLMEDIEEDVHGGLTPSRSPNNKTGAAGNSAAPVRLSHLVTAVPRQPYGRKGGNPMFGNSGSAAARRL